MRVFLSWSGTRSLAVADALASWLPKVINAVDPWISTEIDKGTRWRLEIANQLEKTRFAIVCLTWENIDAPWLLFEAGALANSRGTHVCTFLVDVNPSDVHPPLDLFQHTVMTHDDVRRLVVTINRSVAEAGERALSERDLNEVFETFWPKLEAAFQQVHKAASGGDPLDATTHDTILTKAYRMYQAEDLRGKLGSVVEDNDAANGLCRRATIYGRCDHIVFGPYEPLDPPGDYVAFFRIKIGSGTGGGTDSVPRRCRFWLYGGWGTGIGILIKNRNRITPCRSSLI